MNQQFKEALRSAVTRAIAENKKFCSHIFMIGEYACPIGWVGIFADETLRGHSNKLFAFVAERFGLHSSEVWDFALAFDGGKTNHLMAAPIPDETIQFANELRAMIPGSIYGKRVNMNDAQAKAIFTEYLATLEGKGTKPFSFPRLKDLKDELLNGGYMMVDISPSNMVLCKIVCHQEEIKV